MGNGQIPGKNKSATYKKLTKQSSKGKCSYCVEHLRLIRSLSGSSPFVNPLQRTSKNANWKISGQGMLKFQTKHLSTHGYSTTSSRSYPNKSVLSFELAQNFPLCLKNSAFAEWEIDKKRIRMYTNDLEILFSVRHPLTLSGKVWQGLKAQQKSTYLYLVISVVYQCCNTST